MKYKVKVNWNLEESKWIEYEFSTFKEREAFKVALREVASILKQIEWA